MSKTSMQKAIPANSRVIATSPAAAFPLGPVLILVVSFAVYFNTLFNGFVYDDTLQVLQNQWIRDFRHLPDIFTTSVWSFHSERTNSNYYRPLMHVIYMFNYHIFGLKPWSFHLVNMLFHAANSVLVFFIASRLFGEMETDGGAPPLHGSLFTFHVSSPPFIAALLFAVHPIHTEAVAWVGAVTDLSYTLFFLLSFYFYMRFRSGSGLHSREGENPDQVDARLKNSGMTTNGRRFYILSIASFSLALLCKEPAVVLPLVLAAYDFSFVKNTKRYSVYLKKYIPYIIVAGVYFIVRIYALGGFAPMKAHGELTLHQNIINVFLIFSKYLEKLLLPLNLNAFYVLRPVTSLMEIKAILALAVTTIFVIICSIAYRKNRAAFFGLVLFVVPLLPALYTPALGESLLAERYLYMPSVGFILFLAAFVRPVEKLDRYGVALAAIVILLAGLYSVQTLARNRIWKDDLVLFSDAVRKSPDGELSRGMLGNALMGLGRFDEAIKHFRIITLKLNPNSVRAYRNLGLAFKKKGMTKQSIREYEIAVSIAPADVDARRGLVLAYEDAGLLDESIEQYRILQDLTPGSYETKYRLGLALEKKGRTEEAVLSYRQALALNPDYVDAHYNVGSIFAKSGKVDEALKHFEAVVRLKPDDAFYRNILGITYGQKRLFDRAVEQFEAAVRLAPSEAAYRSNLEKALKLKETGRRLN